MPKPLQITRYILSAFILLCGIFIVCVWVFDFRFEQQEIHLMELELAVGLLLSGSILLLDLLNRHRLVIAGAVVQFLFFGTITGLMLPMERIGQQDDNRKQETLVADPAQSSPAQTQLKVLLVEDDPVNQMVMKAMLKRLGCLFAIAENGVKGVELAEKNPFDLILMDIQMPEMNGIEATQKIRTGNSSTRNVPIIAVSAHVVEGIKEAGFEAGMNAFLEKPVSLDRLAEILEKVRNSEYASLSTKIPF